MGVLVLIVKPWLDAKTLEIRIGLSFNAHEIRMSSSNIMQGKQSHIAFEQGIELLNIGHAKAGAKQNRI